MAPHWYCLYTKPQKEAQVAAYCADHLGLQTYFPQFREKRLIRRQYRVVTGPLFPRYVFCQFDIPIFYRAVRYAPDVTNIVCAGNSPALVTDTLVESLKLWAGQGNDVITLRPTLKPGDPVEIVTGPMQGLEGVILAGCEERERVRILLRFLECEAQAIINQRDIRLIA